MQKKILVIHDDPEFCQSLHKALNDSGFEVLLLRKDDAAVSIFNQEKPDAVILGAGPLQQELQSLLDRVGLNRIAGESQKSQNILLQEVTTATAEVESSDPDVQMKGNGLTSGATAEKLKEFQSLFLAVKLKYARGLPAKVEELGRDIKNALSAKNKASYVEAVRQTAHKLVGTAGSYGFEYFASTMRNIEQTALQLSKNPEAANAEESWERLRIELAKGVAEATRIAEEAENPPEGLDEQNSRGPVFAQVLLVDEDARFLDVVEQLGRQINVAVRKATENWQAINCALMHQLDAAIINVKPETREQSFKLSMDLRSMPGYETLPLAFISSDATMRPAVEAAHVGASLHLDKPLDVNSLEAAVRHLVAIRQGGRPKVMVVDDDPDFTDKIAFDLRSDNLLVKTVNDPMNLLDDLQGFPPDVMLLDVMMPGMNGFQVCQMLRGMPRWRDLPIIFITAEVNVEARVKAFTSGGDDYLPKPVVTEELLARVRVRLEKSRLLKERSDKDTITGLLLRRAFVEQVNSMLADSERTNTVSSICLMDVDHFKKVNDSYGHMAGDRVLAGFGQLLLRRFRVDDLRGRWGGEEFILAFRREDKETMRAAINRIQEEFSSMIFESDDGRKFQVSFSGGIASFPSDGSTLYELLTVADARLYEAKHAGRRRVFITEKD